jgi:hypothetical protein
MYDMIRKTDAGASPLTGSLLRKPILDSTVRNLEPVDPNPPITYVMSN